MLSYEEIDILRAEGAPELFSRDQEAIYQTLAAYYQSKECADRVLFPDQVESLEFRAISHERAVGNEDLQHAYEQQSVLFAAGEQLDRRAAERGLSRVAATHSKTTIRYELSASAPHDIVIPKGARVSAGSDQTIFALDEDLVIALGTSSGTVSATAQIAGALASDLPIGAVTSIIDPIAFVASATNTNITGGGAGAESDRRLRYRVINFLELASNAGPRGAYKGYVLQALPNIVDCNIVSCNSRDVSDPPDPCLIHIYLLLDGGRAPNAEEKQIVLDYLFEKDIAEAEQIGRIPHGDKVEVFGAIEQALTYHLTIRHTGIVSDIEPLLQAQMAIHETHWAAKIGRNVASSKLTGAIERIAGIEDAQADFDYIDVDGKHFAKATGGYTFIEVMS